MLMAQIDPHRKQQEGSSQDHRKIKHKLSSERSLSSSSLRLAQAAGQAKAEALQKKKQQKLFYYKRQHQHFNEKKLHKESFEERLQKLLFLGNPALFVAKMLQKHLLAKVANGPVGSKTQSFLLKEKG